MHRKFQEIAHRTGPTGDPNCPNYVIKAKRINRQLIQMIDASSGGSEAKRSEDGLSDGSDSEDAGAGEFANVINKMNNAAGNGGGRRLMMRRTPMIQGLVFRDWCGFLGTRSSLAWRTMGSLLL